MPDPISPPLTAVRPKFTPQFEPTELDRFKLDTIDFAKPLTKDEFSREQPGLKVEARGKKPLEEDLTGSTAALFARDINKLPLPLHVPSLSLPSLRGGIKPKGADLPMPSDGRVYFVLGQDDWTMSRNLSGLNEAAGTPAKTAAIKDLAIHLQTSLDIPRRAAEKIARNAKLAVVESPGGVRGISIPEGVYKAAIEPRIFEIRMQNFRIANLPTDLIGANPGFKQMGLQLGALRSTNETTPFNNQTQKWDLSKLAVDQHGKPLPEPQVKANYDRVVRTIARDSLTLMMLGESTGRDIVRPDEILGKEKTVSNPRLDGQNDIQLGKSHTELKGLLDRAQKLGLTNVELFRALSGENFTIHGFTKTLELFEAKPEKIAEIRTQAEGTPGQHRILTLPESELSKVIADPSRIKTTPPGKVTAVPEFVQKACFNSAFTEKIQAIADGATTEARIKAVEEVEPKFLSEIKDAHKRLTGLEITAEELSGVRKTFAGKFGEAATVVRSLKEKGWSALEITVLLWESKSPADFLAKGVSILSSEGRTTAIAGSPDAALSAELKNLRTRISRAELLNTLKTRINNITPNQAAVGIGGGLGCFHEFMTGEFRKTESVLPEAATLLYKGGASVFGYSSETPKYTKADYPAYANYGFSMAKTSFDAWLFTKGLQGAEKIVTKTGVSAATAQKVVGRVAGTAGIAFVGVEGFFTQRSIPTDAAHDREASWSAAETVGMGAAAGSPFGPLGMAIGGGIATAGSFIGAVDLYLTSESSGVADRDRGQAANSLKLGLRGFVFSESPRAPTETAKLAADSVAAAAFRESIAGYYKITPEFRQKLDTAAYRKLVDLANTNQPGQLVEELKGYGVIPPLQHPNMQAKVMELFRGSRDIKDKVLQVDAHTYLFSYVEDEGETTARQQRGLPPVKCERLETLNSRFRAIAESASPTKADQITDLMEIELPMLRDIVKDKGLLGVLARHAPDIAKSDYVKTIDTELAEKP